MADPNVYIKHKIAAPGYEQYGGYWPREGVEQTAKDYKKYVIDAKRNVPLSTWMGTALKESTFGKAFDNRFGIAGNLAMPHKEDMRYFANPDEKYYKKKDKEFHKEDPTAWHKYLPEVMDLYRENPEHSMYDVADSMKDMSFKGKTVGLKGAYDMLINKAKRKSTHDKFNEKGIMPGTDYAAEKLHEGSKKFPGSTGKAARWYNWGEGKKREYSIPMLGKEVLSNPEVQKIVRQYITDAGVKVMADLSKVVAQLAGVKLPKEELLNILKETDQNKLIQEKIRELISHMKELHPRAYDINIAGSPRGMQNMKRLEEQMLNYSPERVEGIKFVNKRMYDEVLAQHGARRSYYIPDYDRMNISPADMFDDPNTLAHESQHMLQNKGLRKMPLVETLAGGMYFNPTGKMGLTKPIGRTHDWENLYGSRPNSLVKEADAMLTAVASTVKAGHPVGMADSRILNLLFRNENPSIKNDVAAHINRVLQPPEKRSSVIDFYTKLLTPIAAGVGIARTGE